MTRQTTACQGLLTLMTPYLRILPQMKHQMFYPMPQEKDIPEDTMLTQPIKCLKMVVYII